MLGKNCFKKNSNAWIIILNPTDNHQQIEQIIFLQKINLKLKIIINQNVGF